MMEAEWKLVGHYQGQHPGFCEPGDPSYSVSVRLYAKGNRRVGINEAGEVEFEYQVNSELLRQLKGGTR